MRKEVTCSIVFITFLILALLFFVSCGGGGDDNKNEQKIDIPINPQGYTTQDWQNLYDYNAFHNQGYTSRWPSTIKAHNVHPEIFQQWESSTSGKIQFQFVSYQPSDGISVLLGPDLTSAGLTQWWINAVNGHIIKAEILIHPDYWNSMDSSAVLMHEAGHALGFSGHTNDGYVMDSPNRGKNDISNGVARIMTHLYSYPPHTNVTAQISKTAMEQYPITEQDDGTFIIKAPGGDYYVKKIDKDLIQISNGPFYNGRVESLPPSNP